MILISAGHYPDKPGACFGDFCEHEEAKHWSFLIANHLDSVNYAVVPTGTLKNKIDFINKHDKAVVAIEIHFNSDPGRKGRGSETLYYPGSKKGLVAAHMIQDDLGRLFQPNRGVKEGWYRMDKTRGPDFFLKKTVCTSLIIEPEFIHNKITIDKNRDRACEIIADGLARLHNMWGHGYG